VKIAMQTRMFPTIPLYGYIISTEKSNPDQILYWENPEIDEAPYRLANMESKSSKKLRRGEDNMK